MDNVWKYREETWGERASDFVGYDVKASDGSIGKIDASTHESDSAHVVVDTGFWILEKKRLIPAGTITDVDHENRSVMVNLTKAQVKDAPDYDDATWSDEERHRHASYYGPFVWI